jgi:hypothetical protein
MERKKQTRGKCAFCGRDLTKGGMAKHLKTCPKRQESMATATGKEQTLYHLQIRDSWKSDYWLHVEMNGSATLKHLDVYLRAIWLECCGHLSSFILENWDAEIAKNSKADKVFTPGVELTHIYDFGDSSETLIKVVAQREGKALSKHPIYLMARNESPAMNCIYCDQPARWICRGCSDELNEPGTLCDKHADEDPHVDDYGDPLEIFNSPRSGMCGYDGPAQAPYEHFR